MDSGATFKNLTEKNRNFPAAFFSLFRLFESRLRNKTAVKRGTPIEFFRRRIFFKFKVLKNKYFFVF